MSKIIIAVHGLGNKPDKKTLEEWWLLSMKEGLKGIGSYLFPARFEMVYWADLLYDNPLNEAIKEQENPLYLEERYTPAPLNFQPKTHKLRQKVLDVLEKQMDKMFLENHSPGLDQITDMIIHKYFQDLEIYYGNKQGGASSPRDQIRTRLHRTLAKYQGNDIMLIAHSMGTIIAYDVLTIFKPEFKINTFVTMGSPLGLPNVMRKISDEQKFILNSTQRPNTPPGIQKHWYNFSDLEDKVAMNYNLGDDYKPNSNGVAPEDFIVNNNYTINEINNPHKSYGYLRTPEFTKVLNEFLTSNRSRTTRWLFRVYNRLSIKLGR